LKYRFQTLIERILRCTQIGKGRERERDGTEILDGGVDGVATVKKERDEP